MSLDERLKSVAQAYLSMHEKVEFVIPEEVPANERTAFHGAAAAAHKAGKKSFSFGGKTHPVTMKKDTAKAIADDKNEGVEIEVDKDSEASPEMKTKPADGKKKMKVKKKDDKENAKEKGEAEVQAEGVDTSPAGNSPAAKAMAARDAEALDQAKKDTKADKRRDEDKQDGTNAVKESPKRHNDSKVGEKVMKKFKDMR